MSARNERTGVAKSHVTRATKAMSGLSKAMSIWLTWASLGPGHRIHPAWLQSALGPKQRTKQALSRERGMNRTVVHRVQYFDLWLLHAIALSVFAKSKQRLIKVPKSRHWVLLCRSLFLSTVSCTSTTNEFLAVKKSAARRQGYVECISKQSRSNALISNQQTTRKRQSVYSSSNTSKTTGTRCFLAQKTKMELWGELWPKKAALCNSFSHRFSARGIAIWLLPQGKLRTSVSLSNPNPSDSSCLCQWNLLSGSS